MEKSRLRLGIALSLICCATSCSPSNHAERMYLSRIENTSLNFKLPSAKFDSAWARAKYFVNTFTSRPIEIMDDSIIATDKPGLLEGGYGYKITANIGVDSVLIRAYCVFGFARPYHAGNASRNTDILIHYIKTGELPFPDLVTK